MVVSQNDIQYHQQVWLQYYNQLQISEKFTLYSDASLRRTDFLKYWSQMSVRTGLGYKVLKEIMGVSGMACFTAYSDDMLENIEIRPYQDYIFIYKWKQLAIQQRLRGEFRFFKNISNHQISDFGYNSFRLRYRVYFTIPVVKLTKQTSEKKLLLNFGNEIFISSGPAIIKDKIISNRFLIGPAIQLNESLNLALTYNYQFRELNQTNSFDHTDVIWISAIHKIANNKSL